MFYLHVCLCFAGGVHGDQKKALDALELELEIVVSHHVGAGEPNPDSLQEQLLLAAEPSLEFLNHLFFFFK